MLVHFDRHVIFTQYFDHIWPAILYRAWSRAGQSPHDPKYLNKVYKAKRINHILYKKFLVKPNWVNSLLKNKLTYTDPGWIHGSGFGDSYRIPDPSLKPLQPLYVDSWSSLHSNMMDQNRTNPRGAILPPLDLTLIWKLGPDRVKEPTTHGPRQRSCAVWLDGNSF